MRVLHVINSMASGGAERLLAELLPQLSAKGIEVHLYVLDASNDAFSAGLQAQGIHVATARQGGANVYSPARLPELRRHIKALQPDILHSHLSPSFNWCALAAPGTYGLRENVRENAPGRGGPIVVTTEHAIANRRMKLRFLRGFERFCYGRCDKVVCVSEEVADALRAWLGLPEARLAVVPNGINFERFSQRTAPDAAIRTWAKDRILVAMTARFVPAKDHHTALEILASLPDRYALVCIGDGPGRPAFEAEATARGLADRCLCTGRRDDVESILAASALYLQTSVEEGFGIACLEAMAAGLPTASTTAGGLKTLVGGAGLLFPPGDAAAGAEALQLLAENAATRRQVLDAQALRVLKYSMDTVADSYVALYRDLLGVKDGSS